MVRPPPAAGMATASTISPSPRARTSLTVPQLGWFVLFWIGLVCVVSWSLEVFGAWKFWCGAAAVFFFF